MIIRILKTSIYTLSILAILVSTVLIYSATHSIEIHEQDIVDKYTPMERTTGKYDSVIRLLIGDKLCSGIVISDKYALTAAHCVSSLFGDITNVGIIVSGVNNEFTNTIAMAVAMDKFRDVALLKGNFTEFNVLPVDFKGEDVVDLSSVTAISCGFPGGGALFCSKVEMKGNESFQWVGDKGSLYKGMSGGPLFSVNQFTQKVIIIGINSAVKGSTGLLFGGLVGLDEEFGIR